MSFAPAAAAAAAAATAAAVNAAATLCPVDALTRAAAAREALSLRGSVVTVGARRDAKVDVHEHVGGLHVPVDLPVAVQERQRTTHAARHDAEHRLWQRALALVHYILQAASAHVLYDEGDVAAAVVDKRVEKVDNVCA